MALSDNLLFSETNPVLNAEITSDTLAVTPLSWMQNSKRARMTKWVNPDSIIRVFCKFDQVQNLSYFSIMGHSIPDGASVTLKLFDSDGSLLYDSGQLSVDSLIPAGIYSAGQDAWNESEQDIFNNVFLHTFDKILDVAQANILIDHGYESVEEETTDTTTTTTTTTTESDGIFQQNAGGVVSIRADSMLMTSAASDTWAKQSNPKSGDGLGDVMYKSGSEFYSTPRVGPRLTSEFKASRSGAHDVWIRLFSDDGNSIYTTFDGNTKRSIFDATELRNGEWHWYHVSTVNLVENATHEIEISARDHFMYFGKVVIIPSNSAAPNGASFVESDQGTITTTTNTTTGEVTTSTPIVNTLALRTVMMGDHWQPLENFEHGAPISFLTEAQNYTVSSGYTIPGKPQQQVRRMELNLAVMEASDRMKMIEFEIAQNGKAFVFSAYPNGTEWEQQKHTFLAKFESRNAYSHDHWGIHSTSLILTEV